MLKKHPSILKVFGVLLMFFGGWFTRWWFQIFAIFTPTWGHDPIWLVFFRWAGSTTKQIVFRFLTKRLIPSSFFSPTPPGLDLRFNFEFCHDWWKKVEKHRLIVHFPTSLEPRGLVNYLNIGNWEPKVRQRFPKKVRYITGRWGINNHLSPHHVFNVMIIPNAGERWRKDHPMGSKKTVEKSPQRNV